MRLLAMLCRFASVTKKGHFNMYQQVETAHPRHKCIDKGSVGERLTNWEGAKEEQWRDRGREQ